MIRNGRRVAISLHASIDRSHRRLRAQRRTASSRSEVGAPVRWVAFLISATLIVTAVGVVASRLGAPSAPDRPEPAATAEAAWGSRTPSVETPLGYLDGDEGIDPDAPPMTGDYAVRSLTPAERAVGIQLANAAVQDWLRAAPERARLHPWGAPGVLGTRHGMRAYAEVGSAVRVVFGLGIEIRRVDGRWQVIEVTEALQ